MESSAEKMESSADMTYNDSLPRQIASADKGLGTLKVHPALRYSIYRAWQHRPMRQRETSPECRNAS
jgi:hypothetical protein